MKQTTVAVQPMICRHLDIDAMIGVAKFLDGVASPTFVVDGNGKISSWNRKMHRLSGLSSDEVCERSLSEFLDSSSSNWENGMRCVLSVDDRADAQDLIDVSDCRVKLKQSSISFRIKISANRDKSSLILGAICLASDFSSSTDSSDADNSKHTDATNASILNISLSNQPDTEKNELNRMINSSCAPIFGLDTEGNVNEWNASMATITRMEDSIALGKSFSSEFVAVEYREAFLQILASVLETGTGNPNLEFELAPEINETQCLLVAMNTRLDRNGRVVGVRCMAHDVTEATKRNRVVSAMANELRQLIDTANSPIFGNDNDGNINEWNDMTAQITGFSKEEVMGRSLTEAFIAPNTKTAVQDHLSLSSTGHVMPNFDLDLCTKLGDIRHLLVNATTRRDAENNIIGVVAVAQDVTEAVLRDRAVAGMAFELRQLIDTANAPIFGCDVDFNVNEWNRRTEDITGYLKEDAFGLPIVATFIATSMQSKVQEILLAALHGNETTNYELEFIAKSGETKLLLVNATTRRDPEGNVVGGAYFKVYTENLSSICNSLQQFVQL